MHEKMSFLIFTKMGIKENEIFFFLILIKGKLYFVVKSFKD